MCGRRNINGHVFSAFFCTHDPYRRSVIVTIMTYRKYFGDSYSVYDGTQFMDEEFVLSMLIPWIIQATVGKTVR